jgi:hypothetical protein
LFRFFSEGRKKEFESADSIFILLAWAVSVVFHPLLMPTFLNALIFKYCSDLVPLTREAKVQMLLFIFISTYLLPALAAGLMWVTGLISSITMDDKSERLIPLVLTALIYAGVSYIFLQYLETARLIGLFIGTIALTVGLTAMVTHFYKISSHMMGIGGLLGFMIGVVRETHNLSLQTPLMLCVLCAGAVASSRLLLRAHTVPELLAGFFPGITISWISVHFFV